MAHAAQFDPDKFVLRIYQGHQWYGKETLVVMIQAAASIGLLYGNMLPVQGADSMRDLPTLLKLSSKPFPVIRADGQLEGLIAVALNDGMANLWDYSGDARLTAPEVERQ